MTAVEALLLASLAAMTVLHWRLWTRHRDACRDLEEAQSALRAIRMSCTCACGAHAAASIHPTTYRADGWMHTVGGCRPDHEAIP